MKMSFFRIKGINQSHCVTVSLWHHRGQTDWKKKYWKSYTSICKSYFFIYRTGVTVLKPFSDSNSGLFHTTLTHQHPSRYYLDRWISRKPSALGSNITHSVGDNISASSETFPLQRARGLYCGLWIDYKNQYHLIICNHQVWNYKKKSEGTKDYHKLLPCSASRFWSYVVPTLAHKPVPKSKHCTAHRVFHHGQRAGKSITCDTLIMPLNALLEDSGTTSVF